MDEEIEITITVTCVPPCGAGVTLVSAGDDTYEGKCPLCSREYTGVAGPFALKED